MAVQRAWSRRGVLVAAGSGFAAVTIAPQSAPAAPRPFQFVVDLTHTMSSDFPTLDGSSGIEMQKVLDFKKDGYNLNWWRLIEHAGTHLDAPLHFSEGGIACERIPADTLVVPLAVVNVADKAAKNSDYQLALDDLVDWERAHGRLPDNCCVAMNSG